VAAEDVIVKEDFMSEGRRMTLDEAILSLRRDPRHAGLIRETYIEADTLDCARRFHASAEFADVVAFLGDRLRGAKVLDLGAGNGISSYSFAVGGAGVVYALEPSLSAEIGCQAIRRIANRLPIKCLPAFGEHLPLADCRIDIVYGRQVLHHALDLSALVRECARVLKPGGLFMACREHVVDDELQLQQFLANHPVHQLAGGEHAYSLDAYQGAIRGAGLSLEKVLGPWDSVINAFPMVRSNNDLRRYPSKFLRKRLGRVGRVLAILPGVRALAWKKIKRPWPGRLYSFIALKPDGTGPSFNRQTCDPWTGP
jgi:SAM-dependent methyltransferase